jgi:hypothetical protein
MVKSIAHFDTFCGYVVRGQAEEAIADLKRRGGELRAAAAGSSTWRSDVPADVHPHGPRDRDRDHRPTAEHRPFALASIVADAFGPLLTGVCSEGSRCQDRLVM